MSYWSYPEYVSVGEKKAKAATKLKQMQKKNPNIKPIIIEGKTIANSWWGKSWNSNLERYADYSNRIGRGRSYVRNGAVLDLQIESGNVKALVQGSTSSPYSVTVEIKSIKKDVWSNIKSACKGKLESLSELLIGKFPKALDEVFTAEGVGLFPLPKEINFDCSCPDWASMCKHVAATLYGIGARLDRDPNLFFKLRKVDVGVLITETVKDKTKELIRKAGKKSSRVIEDTDLSSVFGIEIDTPTKKTPALKKSTKGKTNSLSKKTFKNTSVSKKSVKKAASTKTAVKKVKPKKAKVTPKKVVKSKTKTDKKSSTKTTVSKKTSSAKRKRLKPKPIKESKQKLQNTDKKQSKSFRINLAT